MVDSIFDTPHTDECHIQTIGSPGHMQKKPGLMTNIVHCSIHVMFEHFHEGGLELGRRLQENTFINSISINNQLELITSSQHIQFLNESYSE